MLRRSWPEWVALGTLAVAVALIGVYLLAYYRWDAYPPWR